MPVKPDLLGERLEAYAKVAPVLHAFRLCHRFGKGPGVIVTRLPKELELEIETLVIQGQQRHTHIFSNWDSAFQHYEGRYDPMSHLPDSYSPLNDQVFDDFDDKCETCGEDSYFDTKGCETFCKATDTEKCWTCSQKRDPDNCMNTCEAKIHDGMNDLALGWDWDGEIDGDCEGWESMINRSKDGNFSQYDKVSSPRLLTT